MLFFLRPVRFFFKALAQDNTPNQMALGFALGLMIGLVPKGNLIAISLMVVLGAVRVNLGVGMLAALAASWTGILVDPLTHWIGSSLLKNDSLIPFWTDLARRPLAPWTQFNNTIVLGSLVLGLVLLVPAWLTTRPLFAKYTPDWSQRLKKTKLVQVLWGTEISGRL